MKVYYIVYHVIFDLLRNFSITLSFTWNEPLLRSEWYTGGGDPGGASVDGFSSLAESYSMKLIACESGSTGTLLKFADRIAPSCVIIGDGRPAAR